MSSKRDTDLLIKAFLDEGIDELPERSFDAVRTAIDQTRQWAVLGLWKEPQIMNATRLALLAAAIVVVAVVAIKFLPSFSTGPASTPTPTPTLASSASPSLTPAPAPPASAAPSSIVATSPTPLSTPLQLTVTSNGVLPIQSGNYAVASPFLVPFTFTVPSGWSGNIGGPNLVELNDEYGGRSYISMEIFNNVYADPCHSEQGMLNPPVGPSVDDLVAALSKMPSVTVSAVSDGTIGGLPAKQLTLTAPDSVAGCTLTSDGQLPIWELPLGAINGLYVGDPAQLSILEVDGQRLVVISQNVPNDDPISGVFDSIKFTPQH